MNKKKCILLNEFIINLKQTKRRYNLINSNSFTSKLLPTDRYNFSSKDGLIELNKEDMKLPSNSWTWQTDWIYEQNASDVILIKSRIKL
jgi:hypothetical protein